MNYYPFHIGDYTSHTAHLEPLEDLAYRRMLDLYYTRETPLPIDPAEVARLIRMRSHLREVEDILREFFVRTDEGWRNTRAEAVLADLKIKQERQREKANKRWHKPGAERGTPMASEKDAAAYPAAQQEDAAAMPPIPIPIPIPNKEEANAYVASKLPTCPANEIIRHYHEALPELPAVRMLSEPRRKAIAAFWRWVLTSKRTDGAPRAIGADQALTWIRAYFERARDNDFLMGRTDRFGAHAGWRCDFDFLLTEKGKRHVIEKTEVAA